MKLLNFNGVNNIIIFMKWSNIKRYVALILWCVIILALYFTYDIPGSLQNRIMNQYELSSYQFSLIYSVYSWPNIIMCFFGGFVTDRLGPRFGLLLYVSVGLIGMLLFALGGNLNLFVLLLTGRFIIGIGLESAVVALNKYAVIWFSGNELNMVFAIVQNIGRLGSSLVFQESEYIYHHISSTDVPTDRVLGYTFLVLCSAMLIALIVSIIVAFMRPELEVENPTNESEVVADNPVTKISDVLKFPLQFWLLCTILGVYINCVYSFLGLSQACFTTKFKVSDQTANHYVAFFSLFGTVLSPIFGIMIDIKGKNLYYITISIISGILSFSLLAFTDVNPYITMSILAVSIAAILSSIWALFAYIIPNHQIGTAYGVVQAFMNTTLAGGSVVAGTISDRYGYEAMEAFQVILLAGIIPLNLWSWFDNFKNTKILNMTSKEIATFRESEKEQNGEKNEISIITNYYNSDINGGSNKTEKLK